MAVDKKMALEIITKYMDPSAILISSTGLIGRQAYALKKENHFYMAGSLGLASSIGLGLALTTKRKIFVVEGDGALLLNLGGMATIGCYKPSNLVHIVLDNRAYESSSIYYSHSEYIDFCKLASACGYEYVAEVSSERKLIREIKKMNNLDKLAFLKVRTGFFKDRNLPRPSLDELRELKKLGIMEDLKRLSSGIIFNI